MRTLLLLGTVLAATGCAHQYTYLPVDHAAGRVSGQTGAAYAIPPEAPAGQLRVASFGITSIRVGSAGDTAPALHLRLVVDNRGAAPWSLDTREQLAGIPGEGQSRPIYASSDAGTLPLLTIDPGTTRTVDLFFATPVGRDTPAHLGRFDLTWRIDTGAGRVVAQRTEFERVEIEHGAVYMAYYDDPRFFGPYWWYDPIFYQVTFLHPWPIPYRRILVGPRLVGPPPPVVRIAPPVVRGRPPVVVPAPPPHRRR